MVPPAAELNAARNVTVTSHASAEQEIRSTFSSRNARASFAPPEQPAHSEVAGTIFVARTNGTQSSAISSSRGCASLSLVADSERGFSEQDATSRPTRHTTVTERTFTL